MVVISTGKKSLKEAINSKSPTAKRIYVYGANATLPTTDSFMNYIPTL